MGRFYSCSQRTCAWFTTTVIWTWLMFYSGGAQISISGLKSEVSGDGFLAENKRKKRTLLTSIIQAFPQQAVIVWGRANKLNFLFSIKIKSFTGHKQSIRRSYLRILCYRYNLQVGFGEWSATESGSWRRLQMIIFFQSDASLWGLVFSHSGLPFMRGECFMSLATERSQNSACSTSRRDFLITEI